MTGAEAGGKKAYDVFDDHRRERAFSEEVEDLAVEFNKALRHELERRANEEGIEELQGIDRRWEPVARELSEIDDFTRVRADDDTDKPVHSVIDHLAETIAEVDGLDMDDPTVERTVKSSVEEAYEDAVERFADRISDWPMLQDKFETRTNLLLTDGIDRALIHLQEIRQSLQRRRYYERIDTDEEDWLAQVAALLDTETRVPFVDRDELERLPENKQTLLLGRKGAGKSRALIKLADRLGDEVDHVVVPQEQLQETRDIDRLLDERFDGDLLLLWDDIHGINPGDENQVFDVGVSKLDRDLREEGYTLHVLAAARSEEQHRLPRDYDRRRSEFDVKKLDLLDFQTLVDLFEKALGAYDVDADEKTKAEFARKATENDPSPFYVVSIVSLSEGGRLTKDDVEQLPPDALGVWEEQYEDLRDEYPESHTALRAVWLLRSFGLPARQWLVERVAETVFGQRSTDFERGIGRLADMHWLIADDGHTDDPTHTYRIHDIQLEAVGTPRRSDITDLSSFLMDELSDPDDTPREETDLTPRDLHGPFALAVQDYGEMGLAEDRFRHILTNLDSEDTTTHNNYANLLSETGRPGVAEWHYAWALSLNPEYANAHNNYALLLKNTGRPGVAEWHYAWALSLNPEDAEIHNNYANLLSETGRPGVAEWHYAWALSLNPDNAETHFNYGNLLLNEDRHAEASTHLGASVGLWVEQEHIRNAVHGVGYLIQACDQSGEGVSEAVETAKRRVVELAEYPEVGERDLRSVDRILRARPGTFVPFVYGTLHPMLLMVPWRVARDEGVPADVEPYALSAAAWLLLMLPDESDQETDIVQDLSERPDRLRLPARGVFDLVSRGETDVTSGAVTEWIEEAEDEEERDLREREAELFREFRAEHEAIEA